jgi:hypothetical protein
MLESGIANLLLSQHDPQRHPPNHHARKEDGELIASGMFHTAEGFRPIATEGNQTIEEALEGSELGLKVMEADEAHRAESL